MTYLHLVAGNSKMLSPDIIRFEILPYVEYSDLYPIRDLLGDVFESETRNRLLTFEPYKYTFEKDDLELFRKLMSIDKDANISTILGLMCSCSNPAVRCLEHYLDVDKSLEERKITGEQEEKLRILEDVCFSCYISPTLIILPSAKLFCFLSLFWTGRFAEGLMYNIFRWWKINIEYVRATTLFGDIGSKYIVKIPSLTIKLFDETIRILGYIPETWDKSYNFWIEVSKYPEEWKCLLDKQDLYPFGCS